jgi:hypothetical protein
VSACVCRKCGSCGARLTSGPYSHVWFVECVRALSVVNLEIHKHNTPVISTLVIVSMAPKSLI